MPDFARHDILRAAGLDDVALLMHHDIEGRNRIDWYGRYSCQPCLLDYPIQCNQRKALLGIRIPTSDVGVRTDEAFFDPNLAGRIAARTDGFERKTAPVHAVRLGEQSGEYREYAGAFSILPLGREASQRCA